MKSANRGFMVLAVDRDAESLARIDHQFVMTQQMDLEGDRWPLPESEFGQWNAIVVSNYLYRPYLEQLPDLLEEGGILLYETFAIGNEEFGKPSNPNFLLQHGELLVLVIVLGVVVAVVVPVVYRDWETDRKSVV